LHAEDKARRSELHVVVNKNEGASSIRLAVAGRMTANGIGELRREIDEARRRRVAVHVDLTEVTLVDRVSAEYLTSVAGAAVVFENCPDYLKRWIQPRR
jgi:hypothetical protein